MIKHIQEIVVAVMATDFFPQRPNAHPMIYAYEDTNPQYQGLLKVGYTAIDVDKRVAQQYPMAASPIALSTGKVPCIQMVPRSLTMMFTVS